MSVRGYQGNPGSLFLYIRTCSLSRTFMHAFACVPVYRHVRMCDRARTIVYFQPLFLIGKTSVPRL